MAASALTTLLGPLLTKKGSAAAVPTDTALQSAEYVLLYFR
jgi:hypothetical protein